MLKIISSKLVKILLLHKKMEGAERNLKEIIEDFWDTVKPLIRHVLDAYKLGGEIPLYGPSLYGNFETEALNPKTRPLFGTEVYKRSKI